MEKIIKGLIDLSITSLDLFYKELKILEFANNQNLFEYPINQSLDELAQFIINFEQENSNNDELYADELFRFKSTKRISDVYKAVQKLEGLVAVKKEVKLFKNFIKIYSKLICLTNENDTYYCTLPKLSYYKKNTALPFTYDNILEVKKELETFRKEAFK